MPAADKFIALYLISLLEEGKSSHVAESIVYAIKWKHQLSGLEDPTDCYTRNIIECAKRTAKPLRTPKDPLTPEMLSSMYARIGAAEANLLDLRKFSILLLSYGVASEERRRAVP